MSRKTSQVLSWHQSTAEKRMLRKRKIGPPDVYSQENYVNNDLSDERIRKGYQANTIPFEYESLVYNSCLATLDRLDEAYAKSTKLLALVLQQRCDSSACLDKKKRENKKMISTSHVPATAKECAAWFADLARGKMLYKLAKNIPRIRRWDESLEYLCDYRVPPFRALWYLKVTAALSGSTAGAKLRMSQYEMLSIEYSNLFVMSLRQLVAQMLEIDGLSTSTVYKDRWLYISNLSRCAFEEGIIERRGFLNGLFDIFFEYFIRKSTNRKLPQLKVYLLFLTLFLRHITNNLLFTRRLAHMITMKLRLYHMNYDEKRDRVTRSNEAFSALTKCAAHGPIIHILTVILQNMMIDAPEAFVWNKFKISTTEKLSYSLLPLYGSPIDLLPCAVNELPLPPGKGSEQFMELLKLRTAEIVRRSQAVQDNWQFNMKEQFPSAKLVNVCLDVIGILDSIDILGPGFISSATTQIFSFQSDRWEEEIVIRIKLMLHWAVTAEREGTYRAIIVAKIISQQIWSQSSHNFGRRHLQSIILSYLDTEAPSPGSKFYGQEFASLIILLSELSRFDLFDHDSFVKELIKSGDLDYQDPIMEKLQYDGNGTDTSASCHNLTSHESADVILLTYRQELEDKHAYMNNAMPMSHRVLIEMPLNQSEEQRNEVNQRALLLYGMSDAREKHVSEMKKIGREICKMWRKKVYVRFDCDNAPYYKQSVNSQYVVDILASFRRQTYYDQAMICGWCAESFFNMIHDFVQGNSLQLPTSEGLDLLCGMFEAAQHIYGIFELCVAITPLLLYAEKVIRYLAADIIPGTMSGQLAYVFVAYMSKHWHYFLHSTLAPTITYQLYKIIKPTLQAYDYPVTSWSRIIAVFVYHSKKQLRKSQLSDAKLYGVHGDFRNVFNHGSGLYSTGDRYNPLFFEDVFQKKLRFFSYHEYKKRLLSLEQLHNRYSFVMNSFIAAKNCMRNYDSLCELATFCGHISAQIPQLADDWVAAILRLCCPHANRALGYSELLAYIDVSDCSTHYPVATFVMLLAGKYAFSVPRLIAEVSSNILPNVMKDEHSLSAGKNESDDCEPGACLVLLILAKISCAMDDPFHLPQHHVAETSKNKLLPKCADEIILCIMHWCELDNVLFPMLSNIFILMDFLRIDSGDMGLKSSQIVNSTKYCRDYLLDTLKAVRLAICNEDWVTIKMFKIAETNRMEAFNHESLRRNCVGQQLLRYGLRRRSELDIVSECTTFSGNSKKAVIHKLLSTLNMWNMRATLFELLLMFKEVSREGVMAGEALMITIAECCRDLFFDAQKEDFVSIPLNKCDFRFHHITNYWLTTFLIQLCPQLVNEFQFQQMSVSGKCLEEVLSVLDTTSGRLKENGYKSMFLPSRQTFLDIVPAYLRREDSQANKNSLLSLLHKKLHVFVDEVVKNQSRLQEFPRENFLLVLSLTGKIFKEISKPQHRKRWSQLLLKIMTYGIVSSDKYRVLYDSCYDVLCSLILCSLTNPTTDAKHLGNQSKAEFEAIFNSVVVKMLQREVSEQRLSPELRGLLRLLLLPKHTISILEMEPCRVSSAAENVTFSNKALTTSPGRYGLRVGKKMKLSSYDFIDAYIGAQNVMDGWKWCWFQASVIDRHPYSVQKWVTRLLPHSHQFGYQRSNVVIAETKESFSSNSDKETSTKTLAPSNLMEETLTVARTADSGVIATAPSGERVLTWHESMTTTDDVISLEDHLKAPAISCEHLASNNYHTSISKQNKAHVNLYYEGSSASSLGQSRTLSDEAQQHILPLPSPLYYPHILHSQALRNAQRITSKYKLPKFVKLSTQLKIVRFSYRESSVNVGTKKDQGS